MRKLLITFFALTAVLSYPAQAAKVGEKAPQFVLPAADGSTHNLADYAGKVVVLEWYNKDCPFVRKHYDSSNMQNLQREFGAQGVVWFTVNSSAPGKQGYEDAQDSLATAQTEKSNAAHVLLDPEGTVGKLYDAKTTPHMYIIDGNGVLVYNGAIDDKPSTKVKDVETAKPYFRNALEALWAGETIDPAQTKPYGCTIKYKD